MDSTRKIDRMTFRIKLVFMDDLKEQSTVASKPMPSEIKKTDSKPIPSTNVGWLVARRVLMAIIAIGTAWWMLTNGHLITGIVWVLGAIYFLTVISNSTEPVKEGKEWAGKFEAESPYNESSHNADLTTVLDSKSVPDHLHRVPALGMDMEEPRFRKLTSYYPYTLDEIAMRYPSIISDVVKLAAEDTRSLKEIGDLKNVYGRPAGSLQGADKFTASTVKAGTTGELETARVLALFAERHPDVVVIHDLMLPDVPRTRDENGNKIYVRQVLPDKHNHANIDHVVVIGDRIIPVDSKNYKIVDYSPWGRGDEQAVSKLCKQEIKMDKVMSSIDSSNTFDMIYERLVRNFDPNARVVRPFIVMDGYGFETQLCTMQTFKWPGGNIMTEGELIANLEYIYDCIENKKPANHGAVASLLSLMEIYNR